MDEQREAKKAEQQRNAANNAETIRNAADVAIASKNPYGVAAGGAVKAADALTGGKASELAGKGLAAANKISPGGKQLQNGINNINESGLGDKAGKAARMYNGMNGGPNKGSQLAKQPTGNNMDTIGRGRDEPSSSLNDPHVKPGTANGNQPTETTGETEKIGEKPKEEPPKIAGIGPFGKQPGKNKEEANNENKENNDQENPYELMGTREKKIIIALTIPFAGLMLIMVLMLAAVSVLFGGNFDDALGASKASGEDLGSAEFLDGGTKDAEDYYDRINNVKLSLQAQGKSFEALDVAAVFHVLIDNGASIEYKDITEDKITEVANAMFSGSTFDKNHFKEELSVRIIPKYLPKKTDEEIEDIVAEIEQYVKDYNDYIEKKDNTSGTGGASMCASGNCHYDIKGFYINKKTVPKQLTISNLKVRLMQCGSPYGNGNDNTPIKQDLVDFEDYVGGVAYGELGPNKPLEAYKAQMVIARSFALARPTAKGNTRGKKLTKENGQWILQISSCASDQVYCDIEKGCSFMGGEGDQEGWVATGTDVAGAVKTRDPLPEDSKLRQAMAATKGEVVTNSQGYIISTRYNDKTKNKMISLANGGGDYKHILFKTVPKAANLSKMSCTDKVNCKVSTGDFTGWKQCGAPWSGVPMGNSGSNICGIGCLVTSVSMLIQKSGVPTNIPNFDPGTFVNYLNSHGGFASGGNFLWAGATSAAPSFKWSGKIYIMGMNQQQKFDAIKRELDTGGYLACEVKGNTGQHWVAVDSIQGTTIVMFDPGSNSSSLWQEYNWRNTSQCSVFRVG